MTSVDGGGTGGGTGGGSGASVALENAATRPHAATMPRLNATVLGVRAIVLGKDSGGRLSRAAPQKVFSGINGNAVVVVLPGLTAVRGVSVVHRCLWKSVAREVEARAVHLPVAECDDVAVFCKGGFQKSKFYFLRLKPETLISPVLLIFNTVIKFI